MDLATMVFITTCGGDLHCKRVVQATELYGVSTMASCLKENRGHHIAKLDTVFDYDNIYRNWAICIPASPHVVRFPQWHVTYGDGREAGRRFY